MAEAMSDTQAIEALMGMAEPEEKVVKAVEPETEVEEAEVAEEEVDASDETTEAEEETEEKVEEALVVEAPKWWDAEDKAVFAALTPEQQAVIRKQEDKREAVIQKEKAATQEQRKAAMAEIEVVKKISEQLTTAIPDKVAEFKAKYDNVDWVAAARDYPNEYPVWHAQMLAERETLERTIAAKAEADKVSQKAFVDEQSARLQEIAPDLATNTESLRALGNYAKATGIEVATLSLASAEELVILNKARLWDEAQSKAAATAATPKPKSPPVKTIAPVAGQQTGTLQQRQYSEARNNLAKSGKDSDAIAAIMRGGL